MVNRGRSLRCSFAKSIFTTVGSALMLRGHRKLPVGLREKMHLGIGNGHQDDSYCNDEQSIFRTPEVLRTILRSY